MKKNLTRILCLVLTALMMLAFFAACGDDKPSGDDPSGGGDDWEDLIKKGTEENPKIEPVDYQGYEFTFVDQEGTAYNVGYICPEEAEGEILPTTCLKRNGILEDKYNIKICELKTPDILSTVRSQVMGGDTEFDVILASCGRLATMAQEKLLYDLSSIDRFDMTKSYWDSNAARELKIGKALYFTNCAFNISCTGFAVFFNKYLIEQNNLKDPYELIKNNEWTVDEWATMVKAISKDLDGNGTLDEMDLYGTLSEHHNPRMFLYSWGFRATTNDETGYPQPTLMKDPDKLEFAYNKLKDVFSNKEICYCMDCSSVDPHGYSHKWNYLRYLFTQDHYLFHYTNGSGIGAFADMEHEFGLIPFPKLDPQDPYKTMYPYNNILVAIPSCATEEDIARTGNIIEDMNYYSSFTVKKDWFDTLLTRRYARDDESEESLRLLNDNMVYDVGMYFDFGGIRSSVLDVDITNANISRSYARIEKSITSNIKKAYSKLGLGN